MNKYEKRNFYKAHRLISWSFVGIFYPVVGILLAAIGKSILKDIPDQDNEDDEHRISST
jgi:hypothetical protein